MGHAGKALAARVPTACQPGTWPRAGPSHDRRLRRRPRRTAVETRPVARRSSSRRFVDERLHAASALIFDPAIHLDRQCLQEDVDENTERRFGPAWVRRSWARAAGAAACARGRRTRPVIQRRDSPASEQAGPRCKGAAGPLCGSVRTPARSGPWCRRCRATASVTMSACGSGSSPAMVTAVSIRSVTGPHEESIGGEGCPADASSGRDFFRRGERAVPSTVGSRVGQIVDGQRTGPDGVVIGSL